MPTEAAQRRVYTPAFKAEAVELHRGGRSLEEVADTLDVSVPLVKTWVLQADMNDPVPVAPAPNPTGPPQSRPAALTRTSSEGVRHCMVCGRGPALKVTMRSVTGIIIAFRMRRSDGVFCRDCGIAMGRRLLNRTLLAGWWGLFFAGLATFVVAIMDAVAVGRFKRLPTPMGEPNANPLRPGRSMLRRAGIYVGGLVVIGPIALGLAVGDLPTASKFVGKCVAFETTRIVRAPCDAAHDGRVVSTATHKAYCPDMADVTMQLKLDKKNLLCIDLDQ